MKVSKTDIADGKELEGATIQILDQDGNVVEEWVSGKEPHQINNLKPGVEYTLRETVAPEGYDITTDITFTIDEEGKVITKAKVTKDGVVLVEDRRHGGNIPGTGDPLDPTVSWSALIISLLIAAYAAINRIRYN